MAQIRLVDPPSYSHILSAIVFGESSFLFEIRTI